LREKKHRQFYNLPSETKKLLLKLQQLHKHSSNLTFLHQTSTNSKFYGKKKQKKNKKTKKQKNKKTKQKIAPSKS